MRVFRALKLELIGFFKLSFALIIFIDNETRKSSENPSLLSILKLFCLDGHFEFVYLTIKIFFKSSKNHFEKFDHQFLKFQHFKFKNTKKKLVKVKDLVMKV